MRASRTVVILALLCAAGACTRKAKEPAAATEPATETAHAAPHPLAIDTHVDTPQRMLDDNDDIGQRLVGGHLDIPRMRKGGLHAAFFSVFVNPRKFEGDAVWKRTKALTAAIRRVAEKHPDKASVCTTSADVRDAAKAGKACLLIGVEGAHALGTGDLKLALERLQWLYDQGARYMTVTWSTDNPFGYSSTGDAPHKGLTAKGRRLIKAMNEMGMIVDVSHVSDRTFFDIMEVTTKPVFASHSSARAVADHPRNMTDAMIKKVAEGGGAVCVNYYSKYIDDGYRARRAAVQEKHKAKFEALGGDHAQWRDTAEEALDLAKKLDPNLDPPDIDTVVAHFAHIVKTAGPTAACLGSDFDGVPELPEGLQDVTAMPALRAALEAKGLAIEPIFSGNVLRVLDAQL